MNNNAQMQATFERDKNLKALGYTALLCGAIFLVFYTMQWSLPQIPPPLADEGIEVNLGNSETGLGDIAPQIPGSPSASNETNVTPPPASKANSQQQDIATDDNNTDADAPVINKTVKSKIKNTPVTPTNEVHPRRPLNTTMTNPSPKPPSAKALYKGGTTAGKGGNNADSYNGVRNQGIMGGRGDQGNPNGNPNSDSYTGNAASGQGKGSGNGGGGVRITSGLGGRRFTHFPSFEDDFNETAKVAVDITVDQNGTVQNASINPHGTTTTNPNIKSIALRKAKQLKLNAGKADSQSGTIVFNFTLKS
jgi:hypothetical protein